MPKKKENVPSKKADVKHEELVKLYEQFSAAVGEMEKLIAINPQWAQLLCFAFYNCAEYELQSRAKK